MSLTIIECDVGFAAFKQYECIKVKNNGILTEQYFNTVLGSKTTKIKQRPQNKDKSNGVRMWVSFHFLFMEIACIRHVIR